MADNLRCINKFQGFRGFTSGQAHSVDWIINRNAADQKDPKPWAKAEFRSGGINGGTGEAIRSQSTLDIHRLAMYYVYMSTNEKISKWESQVRKGVLDFIVLVCLDGDRFYGYELICQLKKSIRMDVSEGTIYPLLNRLAKDGLIEAEWVEMQTGIPRKYYHLTPKGSETLVGMKSAWKRFSHSVDELLEQS